MSARKPARAAKPPQHRVYEPGKRHMELIASVSRSSGLEKGGDALRDPKLQEEYHAWIQGKLQDYWRKYPHRVCNDTEDKQMLAARENILILYRKLREGIFSTNRCDKFALEVYETSLHLSIMFHSAVQTSSTLSYLLPRLYLSLSTTSIPSEMSASEVSFGASLTSLLSLLQHLHDAYPSQRHFYAHLASLPQVCFPPHSEAYKWVHALARCLRMRNYARLEELTQRSNYERFAATASTRVDLSPLSATSNEQGRDPPSKQSAVVEPDAPPNLGAEALRVLVEGLSAKARKTAWLVLRSAYRELVCAPPASGSPTDTNEWLARALVLGRDLQDSTDVVELVDGWLMRGCADGEVKRKEGENMQGRWILIKPSVNR